MSFRNFFILLLTILCMSCAPHTKREINNFELHGDIEKLTKIASKGEKKERVAAITALGKLGDPRAVNTLSLAMESTSWVEREAIVASLGMINDHLCLPPLLKALKDESRFVRERAASELLSVSKSLGKSKNTRVVRILIEGIRENNTYARTQTEKAFQVAIDQLQTVENPSFFQLLIDSLKDDNRYLRRQAAYALGKLNDERAIQPLIDAQDNRDQLLRDIASQSLKRIHNPGSVSQFVKSLRSEDEGNREKAIVALSSITDRKDVLELENFLQDKKPEVRMGIVRVLGNIGMKTSIPKLVTVLNDDDATVRQTVSDTLNKAGWVPASAAEEARYCIAAQQWFDCRVLGNSIVPELVRRLEDDSTAVRRSVASVLFSLDWQPATDNESVLYCVAKRDWETCIGFGELALSALIRELNDPEPDVIKAVVRALVAIRHNRALQPLILVLETSDVETRILVIEALGEFNHPLAVKTLLSLLEDKHQYIRQAAADALGNIVKSFKEKDYFDLKSSLLLAARDNNHQVRVVVAKLLGELQDPDTIAELIIALSDNQRDVRETASAAIQKFRDTSAIPELVKGLGNKNPEVRKQLVDTLAGFKDYRAIEPLPALLHDTDAGVIVQTIKAMGRIDDPGVVSPLVQMLKSGNPEFVVHAINSLSGKDYPEIIAGLYDASQHKKALIRTAAGQALLDHGWTPVTESEQGRYCVIRQDWLMCEKIGVPAVDALLLELEDSDSQSRIESARTLGHIGDLRAIKPLINSMLTINRTDDEYRANQLIETAQIALGKYGKLALPELVGQLNNWHVNPYLAKILDSTGWLPRTDAQLVHMQIARRTKDALLANWDLTLRILQDDIKSGEPVAIHNALFTLIGLGKDESISVIVKTLKEKGSVELAEAYLNSGNELLRAAAKDWTDAHDLEVREFGAGNTPVKWGEI